MRNFWTLLLLVIAMASISGCALFGEANDNYIIREAEIDSIDIIMLDSFPVRVEALVRGVLGDGCTEVHQIDQFRSGNTFDITIETIRPKEAICTLILKELNETISLDVLNLPAGTYSVDVNGVRDSFILEVDNSL